MWRHDNVAAAAAGPRSVAGADRPRVGAADPAAQVAAETDAPGRAEAQVAPGVVRLRRSADFRKRLQRQVSRDVAVDWAVLLSAAAVAAEADDGDDDESQDEDQCEHETRQND